MFLEPCKQPRILHWQVLVWNSGLLLNWFALCIHPFQKATLWGVSAAYIAVCKAYVRENPFPKWPYKVQYLHFRYQFRKQLMLYRRKNQSGGGPVTFCVTSNLITSPTWDMRLLGSPPRSKKEKIYDLPARGLTYPTWGKGKSSSKCPFLGDMLVPWRVILWNTSTWQRGLCFPSWRVSAETGHFLVSSLLCLEKRST